ncbi:MAG: ABC transporter permease [Firmicutes bacterium]|jgi:putative ABC transport system permease protein|nr:ABC transporter permease [Bacillota bacterium]
MFRFYLGLTAKNLWRQKRRTFLTAGAIAIGIMYFIVFDSLLSGADREAVDNMIDFETGHVQVVSAAASQDRRPRPEELLPDGGDLAREISALPRVKAATPRLTFPASVIVGLEELPILGVGVDPDLDARVFRIPEHVTAGRWLRPGEEGVVLGKRIADLLELEPGDMLTIRTQTVGMAFQAVDLTVLGIVSTPHPSVNQAHVFLPLDVAQAALGAGSGATMVAVRAESERDIAGIADSIRGLGMWDAVWEIKPWREAATFLAIGAGKRSLGMVFLGLVLVIATIGVVNSILLSTLERVREIGILKAMGMNEANITRLFVLEGCGLGILGGVLGAIMAIGANAYLVNVGINLEMFMGEMDIDIGYPIAQRMFGAWNWPTLFGAIAFGVVVALAASYFPAKRAAHLDPVESLRRV